MREVQTLGTFSPPEWKIKPKCCVIQRSRAQLPEVLEMSWAHNIGFGSADVYTLGPRNLRNTEQPDSPSRFILPYVGFGDVRDPADDRNPQRREPIELENFN